jgi:hypothetical protein
MNLLQCAEVKCNIHNVLIMKTKRANIISKRKHKDLHLLRALPTRSDRYHFISFVSTSKKFEGGQGNYIAHDMSQIYMHNRSPLYYNNIAHFTIEIQHLYATNYDT